VKIIRVFPRKTKWTPIDDLAFVGDPPLFRPPEMPVKVSVTFTWDIKEGQRLQRAWAQYYSDVQLGGPAFKDPGGDFRPGMFVKEGVIFTSRGCPNKCRFCFVPQREGKIRELPISDGWIVQDNNLLACSNYHIRKVYEMLLAQKKAIDFNGGLEARRLKVWHVELFQRLNVRHFWFACDLPGSVKHLKRTAELMSGFPIWKKRCYVLIGFNNENIYDAEKRLNTVYEMGFLPFAQLYQSEIKRPWTRDWDQLQRKWCRPAAYRIAKVNEGINASQTSI
jgi:hypothetical protein